jgi:hypothetical protein
LTRLSRNSAQAAIALIAAVRMLNRLETVGETLRHALNVLAEVAPDWLVMQAPPEWYGGGKVVPRRAIVVGAQIVAAEVRPSRPAYRGFPLLLALASGLLQDRVHGAGELVEERDGIGQFAVVEGKPKTAFAGVVSYVFADLSGANVRFG